MTDLLRAPAALRGQAPSHAPASGRAAAATSADPRGLRRRNEVELVRAQVAGIDAWHRARVEAEQGASAAELSREARMDLNRRLEGLRAQHAALVERVDRQLEGSAHPMAGRMPLRAIVVHRNTWFVGKLAEGLRLAGLDVVEHLGNGAEAVGVVTAEQPDLLVVEDVLPMLPGEQVVRSARELSPTTVVVAHVEHSDRVPTMVLAGAAAAFPRQVPPHDVAESAVALLPRA